MAILGIPTLAITNGLELLLVHFLDVEALDGLRLLYGINIFLRNLALRNGLVVFETACLDSLCI